MVCLLWGCHSELHYADDEEDFEEHSQDCIDCSLDPVILSSTSDLVKRWDKSTPAFAYFPRLKASLLGYHTLRWQLHVLIDRVVATPVRLKTTLLN